MDDTTRRYWEQIADQCFDRAYRAAGGDDQACQQPGTRTTEKAPAITGA